MHRSIFCCSFVFVLLLACGDKKAEAEAAAQAAAADAAKKAEEAEREANIAKRKAEREAKAQAEIDKKAKIEEMAVLPEKMPKDLKSGCEEMAAAYDAFMTKSLEGEGAEKWTSAKGTQVPLMTKNCVQGASVKVAACQKNLLETAGPEYMKQVGDLLAACINKFGQEE